MDLRQLAAAVNAHRLVAVVGVVLAATLAFMAHVRVDPLGDPVFQYRKPVLWTSSVTVQLTQAGFFEGRVRDEAARRDALIALAPLYARLANSDDVRKRMRRAGPILGGVDVDPIVDDNRVSLPLIRISSFALSANNAIARARRQANAFAGYLAAQQELHNVSLQNRVNLKVVRGPSAPAVVTPRKITLPVVVFLSILVVTGAIILTLNNLNRSRRQSTGQTDTRAPLEALRDPVDGSPPATALVAESSGSNPTSMRRAVAPRNRRADLAADGSRLAPDTGAKDDAEGVTALPEPAQQARWSRHQPR